MIIIELSNSAFLCLVIYSCTDAKYSKTFGIVEDPFIETVIPVQPSVLLSKLKLSMAGNFWKIETSWKKKVSEMSGDNKNLDYVCKP